MSWTTVSLFQGVLDRFQQIQPKIIFSVDSVIYNGKQHDHLNKLLNVVKGKIYRNSLRKYLVVVIFFIIVFISKNLLKLWRKSNQVNFCELVKQVKYWKIHCSFVFLKMGLVLGAQMYSFRIMNMRTTWVVEHEKLQWVSLMSLLFMSLEDQIIYLWIIMFSI